MEEGRSASGGDAMQIIPIHFNVPGHRLALTTFIETARQTEAAIDGLNQRLFDGDLQYQIFVEPPRPGSLLVAFGIAVVAVGCVAWKFLESDIEKAFITRLTGHDLVYWAEKAGRYLRDRIATGLAQKDDALAASEQEASLLPPLDGLRSREDAETQELVRGTTELIVVETTKAFLSKPPDELTRIGVQTRKFRIAYEARNNFYFACNEDKSVQGIGFDESEVFPIKRSDFSGFQVRLPPDEDERSDHQPWHVETAILKVTSPNSEREDKQRLWKGKDDQSRDRYFKIEDEQFWTIVEQDQLNLHVIDTIKVQWAYLKEGVRVKDARVLRVLQFNDQHLADPLDDNALAALLGAYGVEPRTEPPNDLFNWDDGDSDGD